MPSDASGWREATGPEHDELLQAIDAVNVGWVPQLSVSTVDSIVGVGVVRRGVLEAYPELGGFVRVLRWELSGWVVVAIGEGSDRRDRITTIMTFTCAPREIPARIGEDLRWYDRGNLCRGTSRRRVYAPRGNRFVVRPRRLSQGVHGTYQKLRWRHWGTRRAIARGELRYADAHDAFTVPVRITLSRRADSAARGGPTSNVDAVRPQCRCPAIWSARWRAELDLPARPARSRRIGASCEAQLRKQGPSGGAAQTPIDRTRRALNAFHRSCQGLVTDDEPLLPIAFTR